jgi:hypothetical protein
MVPALHCYDRQAGQTAAQQPTAMAYSRGFLEMRNVAVIYRRIERDFITHRAQTGSQDNPNPRPLLPPASNEGSRFVDLVGKVKHVRDIINHKGTKDTKENTVRASFNASTGIEFVLCRGISVGVKSCNSANRFSVKAVFFVLFVPLWFTLGPRRI